MRTSTRGRRFAGAGPALRPPREAHQYAL